MIGHECGLMGIYGHEEASRLIYFGLYAQQHRGQESAGIVTYDEGQAMQEYKGMGLVPEAALGRAATERLQRQNRIEELAAQRPQVELGVQELADRRAAAATKAAELAAAAVAARKGLAQADEARRTALPSSSMLLPMSR